MRKLGKQGKPQPAKASDNIFVSDMLELNRWCVEMAMRWPSYEIREGGGGYGGMSGFEKVRRQEEDVIGRATKIRDWVTATAN